MTNSLANMNPTEIFNFVHYTQSSRKDDGKLLVLGIGIFADHYFITAGHVAEMGDFKVTHDGTDYIFHKTDAIFLSICSTKPNSCDKDLAIFDSQGVISPIRLANTSIEEDEQLQCYTYIEHQGLSVFDKAITTSVSQVRNLTLCDNFIEGTTDIVMGEGNSGSPLLRGNELVGVLTGNNDKKNLHRILFCMCNF